MRFRFHDDSEMTIYGSSNVRDWTMAVETIGGEVALRSVESGGAPAIERIHIQIPAGAITSEHGSQIAKAHKALRKHAHPTIYFRSEEVEVSASDGSSDASFAAVARGELIIAGERRTARVQASGTRLNDGRYHFTGEHVLLLSDFGVDRPTAMLGALRVADEITLAFDVTLAPK